MKTDTSENLVEKVWRLAYNSLINGDNKSAIMHIRMGLEEMRRLTLDEVGHVFECPACKTEIKLNPMALPDV